MPSSATVSASLIDSDDPSLRLRCPRCGAGLARVSGRLLCAAKSGPHTFRRVDGVPILINPERSLFRDEDFTPRAATTFKETGTLARRIGRWLPAPSRNVSQHRCFAQLAELLSTRPNGRRRVLVVGSGDGSSGYGALAALENCTILETDVSLAGNARMVCDASDLPFDDGSFDAVVCIAVLEHVLEPQRCVDEIHRVLGADGLVYAATPFMQQVHMGEYDFTRFTYSGHRWMFRHFHQIEAGVATGPASVLVWSVEHFLMSWTYSVGLRRVAKALARLLLGWMTQLDAWLARRDPSFDGAGGFFFIGRKSHEATVTPREMLTYYRGADDRK